MDFNSRSVLDWPLVAKREAARILRALRDPMLDITERLKDPVDLEYNPRSKLLFAVDLEYNCALMNDQGLLEDFLRCPNPKCAEEGFKKTLAQGKECCRAYVAALTASNN